MGSRLHLNEHVLGSTPLTKQDRFIAWFLVFQAALGAITLAWLATHGSVSSDVWAIFCILIVCAVAAGIGTLKQQQWAAVLGMGVFAVQVPIVVTRSFQFYIWLGVHFDVAMTWQGQAKLGLNLVGLGMLAWSLVRYWAPNRSFKQRSSGDTV